jgi:hypothetical protein
MADSPQDLLSNPEFQKLSPEAQHIVIGKKFPEYANLSPEAQKIVLSKAAPDSMHGVTPDPRVEAMPAPSKIPGNLRGHPEEGYQMADVPGALTTAGGAIGGMLGGIPGAAAGGTLGAGAGELIHPTGKGPVDIAGEGALQGLFEGAGKVGGVISGKLSDVASQSLARILRLSPKAFQFGREPAQEVLEQGLASGNLNKMAGSIGEASKQTTAQLNTVLKGATGTIDAENMAIGLANGIPGTAGNRFLKVIDDAADKLGFKDLKNLSPSDLNALKQEVARQGKFVEGDVKASVSNAIKQFGGRSKDEIVKLAPDAAPLLESSANLTEASKAADYAVRMEKAGRGSSGLENVDIKKPITYPRALTDTALGSRTLFRIADALKDTVGVSNALRTAFHLVYPGSSEGDVTP